MTISAKEPSIQILISADQSQVEMRIPPGLPPESLTQQACMRKLSEAEIPPQDQTADAVAKLIAQAKADGIVVQAVVAQATEPVSGEDGHIEWAIDAGGEPEEQGDDPLNFYEQSAYTLVEPGQVIAKIIPQTQGTPGKDLFGKDIAAKNGKPVRLNLGKTIQKNAAGELIAKASGPLVRNGSQIKILELIEVPEFVDFSTGNINFKGDVHIHKGVRDNFVVETTGNVIVDGLVEAATIRCGGHLAVRGGFAGREKGTAEVGRNMVGKYLDNIQGEIKGELQIDREIANCELTICGALRSPSGTIMGGKITCQGEAEVAAMGSPSGAPTLIVMQGKKTSPVLIVHRWLRADSVIRVAGKSYKIHTDVRGPIRITVGTGRQVFYARDNAQPMPLIHIATALGEAA